MADKGKNRSLWLNFFRDAGIGDGFETKYALIFDENRIKMNMLMDLNKECLRDMGIKAMGDVIAILKHAKIVHDESMEEAFQSSKPTQSSQPATTTTTRDETSSPPSNQTVSMTPLRKSPVTARKATNSALQPIESTTKKSPEETATPTSSSPAQHVFLVPAIPKPKLPKETKKAPASSLVLNSVKKIHPSFTPLTAGLPPLPVTRKRTIQLTTPSDSEPKRLQEEVPVQKKIRVLPEHEGKYKITMPERRILLNRLGPSKSVSSAGSSSSTTGKKSGIFNRLGDSKVTSTSTIDRESRNTNNRAASSSEDDLDADKDTTTTSTRNSSVFARLGGRAASPTPSNTKITTPSASSGSSRLEQQVQPRKIISLRSPDRERERDRPSSTNSLEVKRRISTSTTGSYSRLSSSSSKSTVSRFYQGQNIRSTKPVYRNPIRRAEESVKSVTVRAESTSTSKMRSDVPSLNGRSSSIKSRLEINARPSSSSSSSSRISSTPTPPKKMISLVRKSTTAIGSNDGKTGNINSRLGSGQGNSPQSTLSNKGIETKSNTSKDSSPKPVKTVFKRIVTKKIQGLDPNDMFDLPELDDPMAKYYDLDDL